MLVSPAGPDREGLKKSSLQLGGKCGSIVCDAEAMIVSLVCRAVRVPLSLPELLLRREASVEAEVLVLRHENAALRGS